MSKHENCPFIAHFAAAAAVAAAAEKGPTIFLFSWLKVFEIAAMCFLFYCLPFCTAVSCAFFVVVVVHSFGVFIPVVITIFILCFSFIFTVVIFCAFIFLGRLFELKLRMPLIRDLNLDTSSSICARILHTPDKIMKMMHFPSLSSTCFAFQPNYSSGFFSFILCVFSTRTESMINRSVRSQMPKGGNKM